MIKGFTRSALIMYPTYDDFSDRSFDHKWHMDLAADKIHSYLRECNIESACFATDDVARELRDVPDKWVITLSGGDQHFVEVNCDGMNMDFSKCLKYPEIYKVTAEKYPLEKGSTPEGRFDVILNRDSKAKREIVKEFNLVLQIGTGKGAAMKLTPKAGSGKLYILIDNTSFLAKCYMSDMEINPIDILGIPNGNAPVYEWEVPTNE